MMTLVVKNEKPIDNARLSVKALKRTEKKLLKSVRKEEKRIRSLASSMININQLSERLRLLKEDKDSHDWLVREYNMGNISDISQGIIRLKHERP